MADDSPTIGIDLGTTYCCVAYMGANSQVDIIKNQMGHRTTPSYVFFNGNDVIIGKNAKEEVYLTGENVVYDSKRLIGQNFNSTNVQKNLKNWPFKVVREPNDAISVRVTTPTGYTSYKPEEVSAKLLKYMKEAAEDRLDCPIKNVVITVPAYFNYHQRTATERAGSIAGLNVLRIINEPTAAALAYVHSCKVSGTKNLLIFDLGGGTFDVSIITASGNESIEVKATSGNTYLGGRDFDENLANFIVEQLEVKYDVRLKNDNETMRRIRARSEKIKMDLTDSKEVHYDILGLIPQTTDAYHKIKREDFERINLGLFEECMKIVHDCLKDAQIVARNIDKVILTGGSSRIPKLQQMLRGLFGDDKLSKAVDPDEAVAYGAAVQAAILTQDDAKALIPKITDVTPLSLGIETFGGQMSFVINRNSPIPISKTTSFFTVYDQETGMGFNIYEGERPLVKHNTKIGCCSLYFPKQPPGYKVEFSLHVNENGVLEVGAKSEDGTYTNLAIDYEKQSVENVADILRKAKLNESTDKNVKNVLKMWTNLNEYCMRVKALCNYDKHKISPNEKDNIIRIADEVSTWADDNEVTHGCKSEERAILENKKRVREVCEPILNKHGYNIIDISYSDFYKLCKSLEKN